MTGYPLTHPGFKDRGPYGTSKAAADGIAPKAPSLRERVLNRLLAGPQTPEAVADALGQHFTVVRPRFSELRAAGLIVPTGDKGSGALGGKALLWRRCTPGETASFLADKAAKRKAGS